ncbi:Amylo-alpha-1,6-glucosidase [Microdochium nivale]|nr:Amylo-alpha-1,6-glucosidase [Microdochium nivale]
MHRCLGNELSPIIADNPDRHAVADDADSAGCDAQFLRLSDGLFENYFLSDCSSSSQVVVTSPTPKDQHDLGDSRLLFAWAAGNSGIVMFFQSQGGPKNATTMRIRHGDGHNHTLTPLVSGVSGTLDLLLPATLGMTILGSVRSLRDFTEGGRVWDSDVQDGLHFKPLAGGGLLIKRQWLDQTTETFVTLRPSKDNPGRIRVRKQDIYLPSGGYDFQAWHNYPFVRNLGASHILNSYHQQLIDAQPDQVSSLSFLSYNDKITAGAWRFLTYFGRDSLLSLLLSQPILSEGETGIIEIILSTVLERINAADGSVCHEEVIGDYATLLNKREGLDSADPRCDYKMVDTDFLLPIALEAYLVKSSIGRERATDFLAKKATFLATNRGISYSDLALATINKVMKDTEAFEQEPVAKNLIRIRNGESVGQWRDSSDGLGGGRTPYDVNTALVPAALQAISSLAKHGIISNDDDWFTLAKARANFWEENTLHFFRVQIPPEGAQALMDEYTSYSEYTGPEAVPRFSNNVTFHGVALRQASDDSVVPVMNTDDCFRLFLLKPTHDEQLSSFLQQAADNILTSFPVGLSTPLGLVVSNPAYAGDARLAGALTTGAYHGTVVWSWQMAMMAAGLGRQLARCEIEKLAFCTNKDLLRRVEVTYSHLWDLIDANRDHLDREVWSWTYGPDEKFHYAPLGTLPGPGGQSAVESNVQQLWSLAFLALRRNDTLIHGVE